MTNEAMRSKRLSRGLRWVLAALAFAGCAQDVAPVDAGPSSMCLAMPPEPPRITGCEHRDINICQAFAQEHGLTDRIGAWCMFLDDGGFACVQSSNSPYPEIPDAAWACGNEPPCGPGFVCEAVDIDAGYHCDCIQR